jgi:hypothetical protein
MSEIYQAVYRTVYENMVKAGYTAQAAAEATVWARNALQTEIIKGSPPMTDSMIERKSTDDLAKRIFDWFNRNPVGDEDAPPYTYNEDAENLTIGVDGILDCRALAAALNEKPAANHSGGPSQPD